MLRQFSALIVCLLVAGTVHAVPLSNVSPIDASDNDYFSGDGVGIEDFTVATNNGVSIALKARFRGSNDPLSIDTTGSPNIYHVRPGMHTATRAWWNFDYQFTPAAGAMPDAGYQLQLTITGDASTGLLPYDSGILPIFDTGTADKDSWQEWSGDGIFYNANTGLGAPASQKDFSDDSFNFVYSNSWNLTFLKDHFNQGDPLYDPFAPGQYTITLEAFDAAGQPLVANTIIANVVPTPAALGVGTLLFGLLATRRPRRD